MKSVLITGASGGIGRVIAEAFLKNAYSATLLSRNPRTKASTEQMQWVGADITDQNQVESAFEKHLKTFHQTPAAVIHCAAEQLPIGPLWETNPNEWEHTIQVNITGSYLVTRTAIQTAITHQSPCSIIIFSGGGAAYARPYFSAYGASKTAVLRLVESTAEELRLKQLDQLLQINAIAPGAVNTAMTKQIINSGIEQSGEKAYQEAIDVSEGEGMSAEHAAKLCLFLSDRNKNAGLSGRLIHVNEPYSNYAKQVKTIHKSDQGLLRRVPIDES